MKVLIIVPSYPKISGVDYHRLFMPHNVLGTLHEDCEISLITEIDSQPIEFLQEFDIAVVNRFVSKIGQPIDLINKLREAGLRYILDLDDDWRLPNWHLLYSASRELNHAEQIAFAVNNAYAITCTHELLANSIRAELGHKNVHVITNGIFPEGQFEPKETNFDKLHFGWSGSITHFEDVLMMHDALRYLYTSEDKDKFRVVYGGYDGSDDTSQAIAGVLSCKGIAQEGSFLLYGSQPVTHYAEFFNHIDVSLIPLRNNRFNNMKSNLKLIESGFKKKAVIVSDVYPYSPILDHKKNCLVVKNKGDWYKHMKTLIDNPQMVVDLSCQLHEDVQEFHMNKIADLRYKLYDSISSVNLG